jgi:hypothetical protein
METKPTVYQIRVAGHLEKRWELWFDGLIITNHTAPKGTPTTTLTGPMIDQAALYGVISQLRDMGVVLISVQALAQEQEN